MDDLMMVTNHEKVPIDDFYLSKAWEKEAGKENIKEARELAKKGELFYAYSVPCKSYALYVQMDAFQHLIDLEDEVVINCESTIIDNKHSSKWEYDI